MAQNEKQPTQTLKISQIQTHWSCEKHSESTTVDLPSLPDIGTPICPECGDDMVLGDIVNVV